MKFTGRTFAKQSTVKTLRKFESDADICLPSPPAPSLLDLRRFESTSLAPPQTLSYDSDSSSSSFSSEDESRSPPSIPGLKHVTTRRVNRMLRVTRDDSGSLGFSLSPSLVITDSTPFARSFGVYPNQVVTHANSIALTSRSHFQSVTSNMKSFILTVLTSSSSGAEDNSNFTINLPPRRRSLEKKNRHHLTMPISSSSNSDQSKKRKPKKMTIKIDKSLSVMHNMSRIEPCLYLGGQDGAAMSLDTLQSYGITHILNVTMKTGNHFEDELTYLRIVMPDLKGYDISKHFRTCLHFCVSSRHTHVCLSLMSRHIHTHTHMFVSH